MHKPKNPLMPILGFYVITAAEDAAEISPREEFPQLKYMKQSSPSPATGMQYSVGVPKKTLPNLPWLPGVGRRIQRHINHHWRANNILARNTAPEAAVIRVAAIVAHYKITIIGNFIRGVQLIGLAGSHCIRLGGVLTRHPHRSLLDINTIARQPYHALHVIRGIR